MYRQEEIGKKAGAFIIIMVCLTKSPKGIG